MISPSNCFCSMGEAADNTAAFNPETSAAGTGADEEA